MAMTTRHLTRARLALVACVLACASVACGDDAPRMRLETTRVRAGDRVVVRFDVSPAIGITRGAVWLSLVPVGSSDAFVGERVILEDGAAEATVGTAVEGAYELRLVDASPRRLRTIVERRRVDVEPAVVATASEPPPWYW